MVTFSRSLQLVRRAKQAAIHEQVFGFDSVYIFVFPCLFPRYIRNKTLEITYWCIGFLSKIGLSLSGECGCGSGAIPTDLISDVEEVLP